jgi:hypothetical protein
LLSYLISNIQIISIATFRTCTSITSLTINRTVIANRSIYGLKRIKIRNANNTICRIKTINTILRTEATLIILIKIISILTIKANYLGAIVTT